jgi:succinyl-CoA synthetase alpha subunit
MLIGKDTRVLVQGITGYQGEFHTARMLEFGTAIVAGVTPGKGGSRVHDIPVFDTVREAVRQRGATAACLFVPARAALDPALEAISEGLDPVVIITEGVPVHDTLQVVGYAAQRKVRIVGPNCPGVTVPKQCKIGIMPNHLLIPGPVGLVSRSGTLTYEILAALTSRQIGQRIALGLGGDPVVGMSFTDALALFQEDPDVGVVVLIGEIGGNAEEEAAAFIKANLTKPVIAYIAGRTAPAGKRMGHAGAVISGTTGTAQAKIEALQAVGVRVASLPSEVADLVRQALR